MVSNFVISNFVISNFSTLYSVFSKDLSRKIIVVFSPKYEYKTFLALSSLSFSLCVALQFPV